MSGAFGASSAPLSPASGRRSLGTPPTPRLRHFRLIRSYSYAYGGAYPRPSPPDSIGDAVFPLPFPTAIASRASFRTRSRSLALSTRGHDGRRRPFGWQSAGQVQHRRRVCSVFPLACPNCPPRPRAAVSPRLFALFNGCHLPAARQRQPPRQQQPLQQSRGGRGPGPSLPPSPTPPHATLLPPHSRRREQNAERPRRIGRGAVYGSPQLYTTPARCPPALLLFLRLRAIGSRCVRRGACLVQSLGRRPAVPAAAAF
ncbi:hypothetical protein PVAP13_9KG501326 [Panicum virgatum]|uniref:Uncharacterized protein n=1 Tax=Panicum virgatum TaxID=38727 RepID=A0A8T0NUR4_PANVG|nr:hypothetical protein PVAP13_9KG501326 [Panicum virgatum]